MNAICANARASASCSLSFAGTDGPSSFRAHAIISGFFAFTLPTAQILTRAGTGTKTSEVSATAVSSQAACAPARMCVLPIDPKDSPSMATTSPGIKTCSAANRCHANPSGSVGDGHFRCSEWTRTPVWSRMTTPTLRYATSRPTKRTASSSDGADRRSSGAPAQPPLVPPSHPRCTGSTSWPSRSCLAWPAAAHG